MAFIDEAGLLMAPLVKKTWALKGHTPYLFQKTRSHKKITAVSALCTTSKGRRSRLFFRLHPNKNLSATLGISFLRQLRQNVPGHLIVIWDRLLAHRSRKTKRFLDKTSKIHVEYLPPYAPELNPVEYVWGYLKHHSLAQFTPIDEDELLTTSKHHICRLRKQRPLLKSFLQHSKLPFF